MSTNQIAYSCSCFRPAPEYSKPHQTAPNTAKTSTKHGNEPKRGNENEPKMQNNFPPPPPAPEKGPPTTESRRWLVQHTAQPRQTGKPTSRQTNRKQTETDGLSPGKNAQPRNAQPRRTSFSVRETRRSRPGGVSRTETPFPSEDYETARNETERNGTQQREPGTKGLWFGIRKDTLISDQFKGKQETCRKGNL